MNSKTKIVVLRMKELIYTGIFILLGLLLVLLLFTMFSPKKADSSPKSSVSDEVQETRTALYVPGIYTASILLGGNAIDLEVTLEEAHISSIRLVNLSEAVTTMYPLMEPVLENLSAQIYSTQSLENISYPEENQYTSMVILDAIEKAIQKGVIPEEAAAPYGI